MKEKIKVLYANKGLRLSLYIIGGLFVLGITFQAGVFVGYHKANFARNWGDHYSKNFGMDRPDSFKGMMRGGLPMAHGSTGKVISVNFPVFVILDQDGTEKSVVVKDETLIKRGRDGVTKDVIKLDSMVVVLGEPNASGQIDAKLVRVMQGGFGTSTRMMDRGGMGGGMMFRK